MQHLICYDITENSIRTKVAKYLESKAHRLQYSIFLFAGSEVQVRRVRAELLLLTAGSEHALLLIAPMCSACTEKLWRSGEMLEEEKDYIIA